MFASTLRHADDFLKSICCDKCHQPSDNLQFIGSSCKHVFCWTCINEICDGKFFALCPLCLLPVGTNHVKSAAFANQLFQNLLTLKENLTQFDISQIDKQTMLTLIEPDQQRRTVEEFCSTQQAICNASSDSKIVLSELRREAPTKSDFNDESLALGIVPDDFTPFTQAPHVEAGTSGVQISQQFAIYKEPKEFQFFKKPPTNSFCKVTAKRKSSARKSNNAKGFAGGLGACSSATSQCSRISTSQRYECNLVNAAIQGSKNKLIAALEGGEDANDCDNLGLTALYHAAARNFTEICKILIENGAVINAHGGELCETALHAAVRWQALDAVKYLLTRGANRRAYNLKGETPMDFIQDDEMKTAFAEISHTVQIVYPSRTLKQYSVFLSTTLSGAQLLQGQRFFNQIGKAATNFETATHLVVPVTGSRAAEITAEILEGMLRGQYVLSSEWLDVCLEANDIVEEEKYEIKFVSRDGQTIAKDSCSVARKNRAKMKPELFRGCQFYFCKHKYSPFRDGEVKKLVELAGGVVLGREPNAEEYIETGIRPYHAHAMQNGSDQLSGLFAVYMPGQFMPQRIVKQSFINLVTPLWIIDCIAKFTLLRPEDR